MTKDMKNVFTLATLLITVGVVIKRVNKNPKECVNGKWSSGPRLQAIID